MRRLKAPQTALFVLLVLMDAVVGLRLFSSGWPKHVSLSDAKPGGAEIQVTPIPFTGSDWLILLGVMAAHAILFCWLWKAWHSSPVRSRISGPTRRPTERR
jgi:hypothetical protein